MRKINLSITLFMWMMHLVTLIKVTASDSQRSENSINVVSSVCLIKNKRMTPQFVFLISR